MGEFVEEPIYAQLARIGKAMSHPGRLRLLDLLDQGEHTVEQLSRRSGIPVKNTSAQLQQLRAANLVSTRRDGTRIYYGLADPAVSRFLGTFQEFAESRLADLREAVAAHLGDPAVMSPITAAELRTKLDDPGMMILDVRSAEDYAAGHIPGAVSVPMASLRTKLDELPSGVQVIAYCQGPYCVVSPRAVALLRDHGFPARPLEKGFAGWRRAQ